MWNPYSQPYAAGAAMGGGGAPQQRGFTAGAIGKPRPAQTAARPTAQKTPFMNQFGVGAGQIVPAAAKRTRTAGEMQMSSGPLPAPESFIGELRFSAAVSAQKAVELSGTDVGGEFIIVELDARSKDGTKIIVKGLPPSVKKDDLKVFFASCGHVAFANIKNGKPAVGQVRFETAEQAQLALGLNGSVVDGYTIQVQVHAGSKDATKLAVFNLPPGFEWQDLKDYFSRVGATPIFVETSAAQGMQTAEVRYASAEDAQVAVNTLNMSWLGGGQINVRLDPGSQDGAKLVVTEVPPGVEWQELKDHFGQVGAVAYANTTGGANGKGGKAGGCPQGQGKGCAAGGCFGGGNSPVMNQLAANGLTIGPGGLIMAAGSAGKGCAGGMAGGMAKGGGCFGAKGGGKGGGCGGFGGGCGVGGGRGEVRFDCQESAMAAIHGLNGSMMMGKPVSVTQDLTSQDGTKILVSGLAPGVSWQELKDHFGQAGKVAFAGMK